MHITLIAKTVSIILFMHFLNNYLLEPSMCKTLPDAEIMIVIKKDMAPSPKNLPDGKKLHK